jgi:iron complex outermembrane receptor protein
MFENGLTYNFGKFGTILEPYLSVENELVLKQSRVPANSDFVAPPSGYYVFNANTGCTFMVNKRSLNVNISVTNFTNATYRDYLDHYRYYCDNLGINYVLRLKYSL